MGVLRPFKRTAPADMETLASERAFLGTLADVVAVAGPEQLIDAFERAERAYDKFPELELSHPRDLLVETLRAAANQVPDQRATPILMFCVALDPSRSALVGTLLERIALTGDGAAVVGIVRMLALLRKFRWADIAPALSRLLLREQSDAALTVLLEVVDDLDLTQESTPFEFAQLLRRVPNTDDEGPAVDPASLSAMMRSARSRLERAASPSPMGKRNEAALALAERVAERFSLSSLVPPPLELPRPLAIDRGTFGLAQFAARWATPSRLAIEWLPHMSIGQAGERVDGVVRTIDNKAGHVIFGPYIQVRRGEYRAKIHVDARLSALQIDRRRKLGVFEVVRGNVFLAQDNLTRANFEDGSFSILFTVAPASGQSYSDGIEVRLWTEGALPFSISSLTVERLM